VFLKSLPFSCQSQYLLQSQKKRIKSTLGTQNRRILILQSSWSLFWLSLREHSPCAKSSGVFQLFFRSSAALTWDGKIPSDIIWAAVAALSSARIIQKEDLSGVFCQKRSKAIDYCDRILMLVRLCSFIKSTQSNFPWSQLNSGGIAAIKLTTKRSTRV
jgi:hypothetical protein